jgi:hypothetical protein
MKTHAFLEKLGSKLVRPSGVNEQDEDVRAGDARVKLARTYGNNGGSIRVIQLFHTAHINYTPSQTQGLY